MELENRVVVISGATGPTGRTAARSLAAQGACLALLSRNADQLQRVCGELGLPAGRVMYYAADLRKAEAAQQASRAVIEIYGHADILLHLVGGWTGGTPLPEARAEDLEIMLAQHVWTTFHLVQAFAPQMTARGWGRIIAVSSPSALNPPARGGLYAAGKAAEEALLLSLAKEVNCSGVTANILQVRTIDVQHQRDLQPTSESSHWTTPEEIAAAVIYLCSREGQVVNGARLPLYGAE
jgi:NAD(P)-dependent dehydrogenase (short-subunit alcohol dehydrogenase family)